MEGRGPEGERRSPAPPVLVFAGGEPVGDGAAADLPAAAYIVAADSGLDEVYRLGLTPDVVVGDLDSVSPGALARATAAGVPLERHPADKDATDLELALDRARRTGTTEVIVLGGGGGRLSHLLGNASLLAGAGFAGVAVTWHLGTATVAVARGGSDVTVAGSPGDLVSLVPAGGAATGIATSGLRWRLDDATLETGSTRGISNEMTGHAATVTVATGTVLVIHERNP